MFETTTHRQRHVIVINRWRERYALYDDYVDHALDLVTYVTTEIGRAAVPPRAAALETVSATDDLAAVRATVDGLVDRFGPPAAIIALKEDDLLVGAALRAEWGCPGPQPADLLPFRDKVVMCSEVHSAGLDVPAFAPVWRTSDIESFAARHGWPVILKPRAGSSSAGVRKLHGPEGLAEVAFTGEPMLVQEYCSLPTYHVDGIFDGQRCIVWRVSRYTSDCLSFRTGTALGSVEIDDPGMHEEIGAHADRFLAALTKKPTVFHLELFVDASSPGNLVCRFLEVGARTGGAEIPLIWREVHDYDLMAAAAALQQGRRWPTIPPQLKRVGKVAGWLLVPAPAERPCRITHTASMVGGPHQRPYAEVVLRPGDVLPAVDSYYEHVGGRFRFRGAATDSVVAAIRRTAAEYRVEAEPLEAGDREPLSAGVS